MFTLTKQTSSALIRTLLCHAALIEELLDERNKYIFTSRFQSDPLERRFGQYRQTSGGRFLVRLRDVTHSEETVKLKSLLKWDINALTEDIFLNKDEEEKLQKFLFVVTSENLIKETIALSNNTSREVGIYISGYIAKKINDRFEDCCIEYVVGEIKENDGDSAYLKVISRGGLTVPLYSLLNYVCEAFALLDYFNEIINKSYIPARTACEYTLINMSDSYQSIACLNHERKIQLFVNRVISNIFLNNRRKLSTDFVLGGTIKSFKKRQRKMIIVLRKGNSIFFEYIYQIWLFF